MYTARYTLSQMVDELNSRGFETKTGTMFKSNSINSVKNILRFIYLTS